MNSSSQHLRSEDRAHQEGLDIQERGRIVVNASDPMALSANSCTRVLLMDDHASFCQVTSDFLERCEKLVLVGTLSSDADDLLAQAVRLNPHVVLVDLEMHARAGLAMLPCLRQALPGAAIIALTLLDSHTYRKAALSAGADELIEKADLIRYLPPAIDRLMHRAQPVY
jgi:DNA-binding NarL/FixJ family response regulator